MNERGTVGLVGRLVAGVVILGVAAASVGAVVLTQSAESNLRARVERLNAATVERLATLLDERVRSTADALRLVASQDVVTERTSRAAPAMSVALRLVPQLRDITLYDETGAPVAAVDPRRLIDLKSVPAAPEIVADTAASRRPVIAAEGRDGLSIAVPVESPPGNPAGALRARVSVESLAQSVEQARVEQTGVAFVAAEDGTILAHPDRSLVVAQSVFSRQVIETALAGRSGVAWETIGGERYLIAVVEPGLFPGAVVLQQTEAEALATASDAVRQLLAILLVVVAAFTLLVAALGRWLLRPLPPLLAAVRLLGRGDRGVRAPVSGGGEMAQLAGEFNRMAEALDGRIDALEAAQAAVRESEERFRSGFDTSPIGMAIADPDGRFRRVNNALERLLGYPRGGLIGASPADLTHPDDLAETQEAYKRLRSGVVATWQAEKRFKRVDGHAVWCLVSVAAVRGPDGVPTSFFAQIQDISARRMAMDALRESESRLRALDEMKNSFLTAVSHELRTPLTSVVGFAELLDHRGVTLDEGERRELTSRLMANALKLERLLGDLLDLDRLRRGILEPRRRTVDIGEIAARAVADAELLGDRSVHLDVVEANASADPSMVERVVENLLANAARHTRAGASVWVRVRPEDGGALLLVEDDGEGVPQDLRESLFQPFRQGPSAPLHAPGVGIGLSLVSHFATLHGGRAWVEDRDGGGASFRVFFPGSVEADLDQRAG